MKLGSKEGGLGLEAKLIGPASMENLEALFGAARVGGALRFNGESTVVNIPNSDSLNVVGDLSIVAWINAEPTVTWACLLSKGADSRPQNYAVFMNTDDGFIHHPTSAGGSRAWLNTDPGTLAAGEWQHIALTYDGAATKAYVNGEVVGEQEQERTGEHVVNDWILRLGNGGGIGAGFWWGGLMDDVGVFDSALTSAEVGDIMATGLSALVTSVEPMGKLAVAWGLMKEHE